MSTIAKLLSTTVLAGALALGLVACGSGGGTSASTSQAAADAQVCSGLSSLSAATADLKALEPGNTTTNQLRAVATSIASAWSAFSAAAKNAASLDTAALKSAFAGLTSTLTSLPGSGKSVQESIAAVQAALPPLEQAIKDFKPNCPSK